MSGKYAEHGVKVKIGSTRAVGEDYNQILDAMSEVWSTLQDKLNSMGESEQEELKENFNKAIPDNDDLGDILFGSDFPSFKKRVENLKDPLPQEYMNMLVESELVQTE